MKLVLLAWFSFTLFAAQAPQAVNPAPEKPTPREKARELLDSAAGIVSAVKPQVQVAALLHLAGNYEAFDKKQALEYFRQAFSAAGTLPEEDGVHNRASMQAEIVRMVAPLDTAEAISMTGQMAPSSGTYDYRLWAIHRIVELLLAANNFDRAIEVVNMLPPTGSYPYSAARQVFKKLPADDPRRVTVFAAAVTAYTTKPEGDFPAMLGACWREAPKPLVDSAVRAVVNAILDREEEKTHLSQSLATSKGMVTLGSRQDAELFDVMAVLRSVDPKRAEEILETRPSLRAALNVFPGGRAEAEETGPTTAFVTMGDSKESARKIEAQQRYRALIESRAAAVLDTLKTDPLKAVSEVRNVPTPAKQAEVLSSIAVAVAEKDPPTARSVLNQCVALLDEIKELEARLAVWDSVADAAHKIQDEKLAWQAIERGLADAEELYKLDNDKDTPNRALREYWPSTQGYRRTVYRAAKLFGVDAEPLLQKIADTELNLLARIEMAQALLGRAQSSYRSIAARRPKR